MNQNLFSKLLRLYRSNLVKVPVEDFITEVFAGLLNSDQQLLDDYINQFLGIHGKEFTAKTQVSYPKQNSIVDMVFENDEEDQHPSISVGIWCNKENKQYLNFPAVHHTYCPEAIIKEYDSGTSIWYETNLLAFLESSSQFTDIKKWIEDHITKFHELKETTQSAGLLDWR